MRVNNINGTSGKTCTCGSWLDHWIYFSGQALPAYCPEVKCTEKPEAGAQVQVGGSTDSNWYIIPLCKKHNGETGKSIDISDYVSLVSTNVSNTCGKD